MQLSKDDPLAVAIREATRDPRDSVNVMVGVGGRTFMLQSWTLFDDDRFTTRWEDVTDVARFQLTMLPALRLS